ncbi:MAG: cytidylate kinase-like family protein [Pseudomonadota bacterium]
MSRKTPEFVDGQICCFSPKQEDDGVDGNKWETPPAVIAAAHQIGSNGEHIAKQVAGMLGLPIYDRQVLQFVAQHTNLDVDESDKTKKGLLEKHISSLSRQKNLYQDEYGKALTRAVVALWERGPCVLVGHGCIHVVPRDYSLAVHLVASEEFRIRTMAERLGVPLEEAQQVVVRTDDERALFHKLHFGAHVDNPLEYDLTIDTTGFTVEACATVIITAMRSKFKNLSA